MRIRSYSGSKQKTAQSLYAFNLIIKHIKIGQFMLFSSVLSFQTLYTVAAMPSLPFQLDHYVVLQ